MTILTIDDALIQEAQAIGQHKNEDDAVIEALREYIARRKKMKIVELFGTVEYDDPYDYKKQRRSL